MRFDFVCHNCSTTNAIGEDALPVSPKAQAEYRITKLVARAVLLFVALIVFGWMGGCAISNHYDVERKAQEVERLETMYNSPDVTITEKKCDDPKHSDGWPCHEIIRTVNKTPVSEE